MSPKVAMESFAATVPPGEKHAFDPVSDSMMLSFSSSSPAFESYQD